MKDRDYRTQKARVRRMWRELRDRLGTSRWMFHLRYADEHKNEAVQDSYDTCADCLASWQYEEATITFYLPKIADLNDEELRALIIHEVYHAWVNEMREVKELPRDIKHEERVVTHLSNVNQWAFEAGRRAGLKEARQKKRRRKR